LIPQGTLPYLWQAIFVGLSTELVRWTQHAAASGAAGRANVGLCPAPSCAVVSKPADRVYIEAGVMGRNVASTYTLSLVIADVVAASGTMNAELFLSAHSLR